MTALTRDTLFGKSNGFLDTLMLIRLYVKAGNAFGARVLTKTYVHEIRKTLDFLEIYVGRFGYSEESAARKARKLILDCLVAK